MEFFKKENRTYKVFVDFDGTITTTDVGEHMFLKFGDAQEAYRIIQKWIDKEITSTESWRLLCRTIDDFDEMKMLEFIDEIKIDPAFFEFEKFCRNNSIDMFVLSDGLDFYIEKILDKNKLSHLKVYSNLLKIDDKGNLIPGFPFGDEECKECANCKRNHIINNSSDDDYTIYVGDGYSDTCPAQHTDFIFAKNSLLKFCEAERVSFYPFDTFADVQNRLQELLNRNRLRKRHQAVLKRKETYKLG